MLDRNMVIGIFLAKGNFIAKIEPSETTAIGYHIRMQANISFRTYDMQKAFSRALNMYGMPHSLQGSLVRLGEEVCVYCCRIDSRHTTLFKPEINYIQNGNGFSRR